MRRILLILLAMMPIFASAQDTEIKERVSVRDRDASHKPTWFPFELNKSVSMGLSAVGWNMMEYGAVGVNATVFGVYADFIYWPPQHANDLGVDQWEDSRVRGYHIGYQIPIYSDPRDPRGSVRIVPMIGKMYVEYGITDGSHYTIGDNAVLYNSFHKTREIGGLDWGAALVISKPIKNALWWNLNVTFTEHTAIAVGLGLEIAL